MTTSPDPTSTPAQDRTAELEARVAKLTEDAEREKSDNAGLRHRLAASQAADARGRRRRRG